MSKMAGSLVLLTVGFWNFPYLTFPVKNVVLVCSTPVFLGGFILSNIQEIIKINLTLSYLCHTKILFFLSFLLIGQFRKLSSFIRCSWHFCIIICPADNFLLSLFCKIGNKLSWSCNACHCMSVVGQLHPWQCTLSSCILLINNAFVFIKSMLINSLWP